MKESTELKKYIKNLEPYERILFICVLTLGLISFFFPALMRFDHDEFEHIHCAWYLAKGFLPYQDFFQNHNPFYWYLIKPIYLLTGDSLLSVICIRYLNYLFLIGSILGSHLITFKLTRYRSAAWITTLLLFSCQLFFRSGVYIRPDVPQVFFGVVSVYFFLKSLKENQISDLILCGLSISISFLFLQKAIFLVLALGMCMFYRLIKKQIQWTRFLILCLSALLPILLFIFYLYQANLLADYYTTNILVNMNRILTFSPLKSLNRFLGKDFYIYFIFMMMSWNYLRYHRKIALELKFLLFIAWFLFGTLFLVNRPHHQNFMQMVPIFAILSGVYLKSCIDELKPQKKLVLALVILMMVIPLSQVRKVIKKNNLKQLKQINYVIKNTDVSDYVYDGDIKFNLFRKDLHYFWYSVDKGKLLESYNLVTDNKYGDYNIYNLIKTKKPKIISDYEVDVTHPQIAEFYSKTKFEHVYKRN